jgi:transcriptional regulator GlxA family with amidase domain
LIGEDLGEQVARQVAQELVVYYRRPGGQSQFSALLQMERVDGRFAGLLDYIRVNLAKRLSVADLARYSNISPRHFSRLFQAEVGVSPAKAVERLRVEAARAALVSGPQSNQRIARSFGFRDTERMRRSFRRVLAATPAELKALKQMAP